MKNKILPDNLQQKANKKNSPTESEGIQNNPDRHIDQDFTGYPHAPASKELINPKTKQEKKAAAVDSKDGEKIIDPQSKKKNKLSTTDKENSDGSANAFDSTERVQDDE